MFFFKGKRPLASFSVVAEVWVKPHPWKFLLMARDAPKRTIIFTPCVTWGSVPFWNITVSELQLLASYNIKITVEC